MRTIIQNGILITPQEALHNQTLVLNEGQIESPGTTTSGESATTIDAQGVLCCTGFH